MANGGKKVLLTDPINTLDVRGFVDAMNDYFVEADPAGRDGRMEPETIFPVSMATLLEFAHEMGFGRFDRGSDTCHNRFDVRKTI